MNLQLILVFLSTFLFVKRTRAKETFENSTNLCTERCHCNLSDGNSTLYIDCAKKQMEHTIANWPEHPKNLVATFSGNEIVTLEKMPGSGAEDIKLVFSNCKIKYLDSGLFESTVNVKYLDLSHNFLESEQLSADVFKGPYNNSVYEPISLEHLDLAYNQIHSLQKKLFEHTPNLKFLNLEGNALRVIDHVSCLALSKVTKMQVLNVANNRLTELPSDAIKHFPNLTEINLSYNELDFVPVSLGYIAASLQILNISHNPIIELEHDTFEGLENVWKLFSQDLNELIQIKATAFSPLQHLKILYLCHNKKLEEIDEDAFLGNVDQLEEVYLNDNSLMTLPTDLLPWSQLKVLDITNNPFTCNCDLHNISEQLSDALKTDQVGPFCINPRSFISTEIYSLTNETCNVKPLKGRRRAKQSYGDLRVMRITLTTLIVVLIVSASVAMWLGYSKWRTYQRSLNYPFPNQVIYSPVSTVEFPRF